MAVRHCEFGDVLSVLPSVRTLSHTGYRWTPSCRHEPSSCGGLGYSSTWRRPHRHHTGGPAHPCESSCGPTDSASHRKPDHRRHNWRFSPQCGSACESSWPLSDRRLYHIPHTCMVSLHHWGESWRVSSCHTCWQTSCHKSHRKMAARSCDASHVSSWCWGHGMPCHKPYNRMASLLSRFTIILCE